MSDNPQDNPADNQPPAQTPPAGDPPKATPQPGDDWEKRYKGLQTAYNKLQEQKTTVDGQLASLQTDYEALQQQVNKGIGDQSKLQDEISSQKGTLTQKETEIASLSKQIARLKLLMTDEYISLAPFETRGLLPDGKDDEDLKTKFSSFQEAYKATIKDAVKDELKGAGPGPTNPADGDLKPRTREVVYAELNRLAGSRDPAKRERYEQVLKEWDQLTKD
jgi:chromosome segregation ATPase